MRSCVCVCVRLSEFTAASSFKRGENHKWTNVSGKDIETVSICLQISHVHCNPQNLHWRGKGSDLHRLHAQPPGAHVSQSLAMRHLALLFCSEINSSAL